MRSPHAHSPNRRQAADRVTMTPMIDVVFLLIIFFLVSSHLSRRENRMPVSLADSLSGSSEFDVNESQVTVTLDADHQLFVNGNRTDPSDFISGLPPDRSSPIRIRVDRSIAYEHLERVLGELTRNGFADISIVTHPASNSGGKGKR